MKGQRCFFKSWQTLEFWDSMINSMRNIKKQKQKLIVIAQKIRLIKFHAIATESYPTPTMED